LGGRGTVGFYYGDMGNWLSVMRDLSNYFVISPVNMIYALKQALENIFEEGLQSRAHGGREQKRHTVNSLGDRGNAKGTKIQV